MISHELRWYRGESVLRFMAFFVYLGGNNNSPTINIENTTITSKDVFKYLEQNTKKLNLIATKGHNYGEPEISNTILGKSGIVKQWKP